MEGSYPGTLVFSRHVCRLYPHSYHRDLAYKVGHLMDRGVSFSGFDALVIRLHSELARVHLPTDRLRQDTHHGGHAHRPRRELQNIGRPLLCDRGAQCGVCLQRHHQRTGGVLPNAHILRPISLEFLPGARGWESIWHLLSSITNLQKTASAA